MRFVAEAAAAAACAAGTIAGGQLAGGRQVRQCTVWPRAVSWPLLCGGAGGRANRRDGGGGRAAGQPRAGLAGGSWRLDPALIDGALQLARVWGYANLHKPTLPTACERLTIWQPGFAASGTLRCVVQGKPIGQAGTRCDLWLIDEVQPARRWPKFRGWKCTCPARRHWGEARTKCRLNRLLSSASLVFCPARSTLPNCGNWCWRDRIWFPPCPPITGGSLPRRSLPRPAIRPRIAPGRTAAAMSGGLASALMRRAFCCRPRRSGGWT